MNYNNVDPTHSNQLRTTHLTTRPSTWTHSITRPSPSILSVKTSVKNSDFKTPTTPKTPMSLILPRVTKSKQTIYRSAFPAFEQPHSHLTKSFVFPPLFSSVLNVSPFSRLNLPSPISSICYTFLIGSYLLFPHFISSASPAKLATSESDGKL